MPTPISSAVLPAMKSAANTRPWVCSGLERWSTVRDGPAMSNALVDLKEDAKLRASLARHGLETILARHTCGHRVDELMGIVERLRAPVLESAA